MTCTNDTPTALGRFGAADSVLTEPPALGAIDPDAALAALDESSYCTGGEFVADGGDIAGHNLTASFG